ncbi:MAG: hypothetical protein PHR38_01450 [Bacteroidales bacterium]|nr:hypothetical protein [Bacteroidales bacterium]MDD4712429.1 hypothetical protein [Bacteroidales bacterium]
MMKKQLLTTAFMLTGIFALITSAEAKSSMDSNLTLLWMNTDVAPLETSARQGFGQNGKFYLQNKDTKKIEVWDQTGKINEISSGEGTNITYDDAGNIIVRVGTFNTPYVSTRNELRIIPADGSAVIDIPLSGITAGRLDFWGHVRGNVLDKVTGGVLYMGTTWYPSLIEIPIIGGQQDVTNTYTYSYTSPFGVSGNFATTTIISGWEGVEDLALLSPLYNKTNCNSIQKMALDVDTNWVHNSYYVTPRHNGCAGFYIFKLGEQKYIVYPSGSNNADGFTVSKLTTKAISSIEDGDETVRIATKYSEEKDDGTVMYANNAFYGNHLNVEVVSATEAYIYQYFPKGYIAKYSFKVIESGISGIEAGKVTVIGGKGEITITGEASSIEVYAIGGTLISKNQKDVKCAPGTYIVKVDNNVTKVMVK